MGPIPIKPVRNLNIITKTNTMRKIILPAGTLLLSGFAFGQLSPAENYIYTKTYLDYPSGQTARVAETVEYFDGLGRAKQVINVKATPLGNDLVIPITYDGLGRRTKEILPTPTTTHNLAIHSGITDESAANAYYGVSNAYSEKQVENSALDRVLQQAQPGEAWKLTTGHTQKIIYVSNTTAEVKKFVATTTINTVNGVSTTVSVLSVSTENSSTVSNGFYAANTLYKTTVTDEDDNPVTEFKNSAGQIILVRRTDGIQNIDTYYVYDQYGQQAFIIPPKAVKEIQDGGNAITPFILNELCYQYSYDRRKRVVEKKLPGKGREYLVYDKQDRLVLTRDANLEAQGKWLFSKYDEFSRPIYTGLLNSPPGRAQQVIAVEGFGANNEMRTSTSFNNTGIAIYYSTNLAYPQSNYTLLSVNYYDTYPQLPAGVSVPTSIIVPDQIVLQDNPGLKLNTKDLLLASYLKNVEDDNWTKTYNYYDTKGRVVGTHSVNHLGGYTRKELKLDFSALMTESYTYHKRKTADAEVIVKERFIYDNQNRLKKHYHQVNNLQEELLAESTYNEIGQLINKKTGNTTGVPLQSLDYTYNIRGWLTSVNNPNNPGSFAGKLFGIELKYNNPSNAAGALMKYNGNISQSDWKTSTDGVLRRYTYEYDKLDRMFSAVYSKPNATVVDTNAFNEWLMYDVNGNIIRIDRYGGSDGNQAQMIDELDLFYEGNKLTGVSDYSGNSTGYPVYNTPNLMTYDLNGNMTNYKDKRVKTINYNHLNLPVKLDRAQEGMTTGPYVNFKYRSDGVKVEELSDNSNSFAVNTKEKNYLDDFHYERIFSQGNGGSAYDTGYQLKFFPTSEGYYNFEKKLYIYNYTDQVGNIRVSYYKDNSGALILDRESNYYPFGLEHQGYNYNENASQMESYRYGFQGQENQFETGWNSFKWRNNIPELGRWMTFDPLAEKMTRYSPYSFAYNNPLRFIDPDGRESEDIIIRGKDKKEWRIITAGDDKVINVPVNLNKNRTLDIGAKDVDVNRFAVGYTVQADVGGGLVSGANAGLEMSVVQFTDKTYGGYNYVYAGGHTGASLGVQEGASASVGASVFVAYNNNNTSINPSSFEGKTVSVGGSFDFKAIAGGGVNVNLFSGTGNWQDRGWHGVSIGASVGVGESVNVGSANASVSRTYLINSYKPTSQRGTVDRIFNAASPVASAILNPYSKNIYTRPQFN